MYTEDMPFNKLVAGLLVLFLGVGIFVCANLAISSQTHDLEAVSQICPPSGSGDSCSNLTEHLVFWQTVLTAIPSTFNILIISLLLLALLPRPKRLPIFAENPRYKAPSICRTGHSFFPKHALQEAFSDGILHSKAF